MTDSITIQELLTTAVIAAPLVTGLVEVIKRTIKLSDRWIPVTALIVGLLTGLVIIQVSIAGGVAGLIIGLTSVGLWEVGKTSVVASKKQ